MTNGTSQGLFIVVSIVIFGIFVALSYTVFGDNLSPGIQGMFSDATEQALVNLRNEPKPTIGADGRLVIAYEIKNVTNESYDIYLYGLGEDVDHIRFPTWSAAIVDTEASTTEPGQDDLAPNWMNNPVVLGTHVERDVWKFTVVNNQFGDYGEYITDIYVFNEDGVRLNDIYRARRIRYDWIKQ